MASVLSLTANSPLQRTYVDHGFSSTSGPIDSSSSVQNHQTRRFSSGSFASIGSPSGSRQFASSTARSVSTLNLTVLRANFSSDRRSVSRSINASRPSSLGSAFSSRVYSDSITEAEHRESRLVGVAESEDEAHTAGNDGYAMAGSMFGGAEDNADIPAASMPASDTVDDLPDSPEPTAFRRWVSTLRRKKQNKPAAVTPRTQRWSLDDSETKPESPPKQRPSRHHKSNSYASSTAFVSAVKSATATIASASIATISRRNSRLRRAQQHSSVLSGSDPRPSVDTQRSIIDEAARQRSRKRREKLEEFIRTEESYVADLKALSNVCVRVTVPVGLPLIQPCRPTVRYSATSLQLGQRVLRDA